MLQKWVATLIFSAFVCFVMLLLTPQGRIKRAAELVCGIVMVTALLSVLTSPDMRSYSEYLTRYRNEAEALCRSGEEYSENLERTVIEEKTEAYILDKAESIGAELSDVSVLAEWSSDRCWYPSSAQLRGSVSEDKRQILSRWMEAELGITEEMQTWNG